MIHNLVHMIGLQLHSTTALNGTSTVSGQKRRDLTWKTNLGKSSACKNNIDYVFIKH